MKQNILLVCYDNDIAEKVAEKLADFFSMRVLNCYELFEFDFMPRSLSQMVAERGTYYVKSELGKTVKYSSDYENVILVADISMAETCRDCFDRISSDYVSILLYDKPETEEKLLLSKKLDDELKKLLLHSKEELDAMQQLLKQNLDRSICITNLSFMDIFIKTIAEIKSVFNMN